MERHHTFGLARRRSATASALAVVLLAVSFPVVGRAAARTPAASVADGGTCLYSANRIDRLESFSDAIERPIQCAVVFNNAAPTWPDLVKPWFVIHRDPNLNWADWKRAEPGRQLIITQSMVPDQKPQDWRQRAAAGEYDGYARQLATNLVAAGLGDSVIRLSHEANGLWTKDGLGSDPKLYRAWRGAWRHFAKAMQSVPGADFQFDWTVNPGIRPIPFDDYYPGNDVVDIIGVDIYDYWEDERFGPAPDDLQARWDTRFAEPAGAGELIAFAEAHRKPLSIPEWGLRAVGSSGGLGDDPSFVENIVRLVGEHDVVYQAYFEKSNELLLMDAPRAFEVYRNAFGGSDPPCS